MSKSILKGNLALFHGHKFIIFILSSAIVGLAKLTARRKLHFYGNFSGSVQWSKKKRKRVATSICVGKTYTYSPIWLTWNFTIYIKIYVTLFSRLVVPPISLAIDSVPHPTHSFFLPRNFQHYFTTLSSVYPVMCTMFKQCVIDGRNKLNTVVSRYFLAQLLYFNYGKEYSATIFSLGKI